MVHEALTPKVSIEARAQVGPRPREMVRNSQPRETKWGGAVTGGINGYQLVPDALIRNQGALKLDATDIVVLLNICMHWWESEPNKMPHPRPVTIAKRIGTSTRTVERHIARLGRLGLLEWLPPEARANAPSVRKFNLKGLMDALERLASNANGEDAAEDSTRKN
jgi:hypothetical protein